ncbi:MAG: 23S rRNA (pseudouridine(1915)-N(3))-methyltransferase RlmH, partial [Lachnospiraceae bacterium]|nr:23S rRNA (pseudouridine(1915)-N(3))-methyltransferase RlmH [Lachnospiraceae bacterium]
DGAPAAVEERILRTEGERILHKIPAGSYVITLEIKGEMVDSVGLSRRMDSLALKGESHLCLIIGGSLGLAPEVSQRADWKLSFSPMTFPHQLMKVILLEQIYRACRISSGEPYHK